jgi:hypothetical protein
LERDEKGRLRVADARPPEALGEAVTAGVSVVDEVPAAREDVAVAVTVAEGEPPARLRDAVCVCVFDSSARLAEVVGVTAAACTAA